MSRQAAATFLGKVRADSDLRNYLGPTPTPESYLAAATHAGLAFTFDELKGVAMAEQFFQKTINDPVLYARLRSIGDERAIADMARKMGFACGPADLQAVLHPSGDEELSSSELEAVTGGWVSPRIPAPPAPYVPVPYPNGW